MWPELEPDQPLARPYFSPRQLVTADDLNSGVAYLVERTRRHNRFLHGCGISCGLEISLLDYTFHPEDFQLQLTFHVSAGTAIGPHGDLILIDASQHIFAQARVLDDGEEVLQELGHLINGFEPGRPLVVYLLVRHTNTQEQGHMRPTYPDDCHHLDGSLRPTRLSEWYELALATARPSDCATPAGQLCGPLLNRRSPQHEATLAHLMGCPPPVVNQEWLVVASVELEPLSVDDSTIQAAIHYRDRTLLPSARVLWELLGCFPEMPCIKNATIKIDVDDFVPPRIAYIVTVTGYGLTPLREVIVGDGSFGLVRFDQNQENDRQIVITIFSERGTAPQERQPFRIITEFDELNSADFDVYLDFPLIPQQPEPILPANPIDGGNP